MGKIFVIGVGPGSEEFLTQAAKKAAENADVLVGGKSALALFPLEKSKKAIDKNLDEVLKFIKKNQKKNIAILTSGDPGFFSISGLLLKKFPKEDIEVIPGISSMQHCFARIKETWQDAKFLSLHGRQIENLKHEIKNKKVVILTDPKSTPDKVAKFLLKEGNRRAVVCENLSSGRERVVESDLEGIARQRFSGNCVMVIFQSRQPRWSFATPGIPDKLFSRGGAPITKEEIRVITLAKARLKKDSTVYDIGAGTGSISVEAALLAKNGKVFAIEKNPDRISLIRKNIEKFRVSNVEVIEGEAPEVLKALPGADRMIIGGSGGKIRSILMKCDEKLKVGGRVVINALKPETLRTSIEVLKRLNYNFGITQVSVKFPRPESLGVPSREILVNRVEAAKALNTVFIIHAERRQENANRRCGKKNQTTG